MTKYKFGIPEWAMPMNGQYGCRVAHEAGLQGIQLNMGDASRGWPLSHYEMQRIYLEEAQKWEIEYPSLAVNSLCDIGMTRKPGTPEREIAKQGIVYGIETAHAMNIPIVMLPTFHDSFIHDAEDEMLVFECVKEACEYADKYNIIIALENVMRTDQFIEFSKKITSGNLKIMYDSQNYSVCKGWDNTLIYKEVKEYVCGIHMKDGFDEMSTHILGEGGSNFYDTVRAIKESEYSGWIYVENYYDQDRLGEMRKPYELLKRDVEIIKSAFIF
jgi:sugar phosphate isomerase/epimerase